MSQRFQQIEDTVLDTQTGLKWQATSLSSMTWQQAMDYAVGLGNNWRLPTRLELEGLLNLEKCNPATDFPRIESDWFWSSSSHANNSSGAWNVYFGNGHVLNDVKSLERSVRCVRAGLSKIRNFEPSDDKKLGLFQKLRLRKNA